MSYALVLLNTNTPFIFLFGPLILLYSRSLTGTTLTNTDKLIHFLPFVFYFGYSFNFFLQDPAFKFNILAEMHEVDVSLKSFTQSFPSDPWNIQGWVVVEILSLHLITYGVLSLLILKKRGSEVSASRFHWIRFLNILLIIGGSVLFLSEGGVINGVVFFESPFPKFSSDLFSTFGMYVITFFLLTKPEFLKSSTKKYSKSSLSKEYMKEKLSTIQQSIESDKLFLDSNFSLELLAKKTGLSKHHISQIINSELDCNFFDLTNRYRIEEAKRVLRESQHIKMEQLAYQLGYKSKSSFFNAFKRATNLTPSRYLIEAN